MQDGKVTCFLKRCLRLGQCEYDENLERYIFDLRSRPFDSDVALFVYPRGRRIWFLATEEYWVGEFPDGLGFGGYSDEYDAVVLESIDKKGLSSKEAANMLFELLTKYDENRLVSKRSLRLLR